MAHLSQLSKHSPRSLLSWGQGAKPTMLPQTVSWTCGLMSSSHRSCTDISPPPPPLCAHVRTQFCSKYDQSTNAVMADHRTRGVCVCVCASACMQGHNYKRQKYAPSDEVEISSALCFAGRGRRQCELGCMGRQRYGRCRRHRQNGASGLWCDPRASWRSRNCRCSTVCGHGRRWCHISTAAHWQRLPLGQVRKEVDGKSCVLPPQRS